MFELIEKGGPLMWLLLCCGILSLAVFLERLFYYHRCSINVGEFLQGLANLIKKKNYAEALHESTGTPGPIARVIHAAIIQHERPRAELKEIVQEAGQLEVPKLERSLAVLSTIALVAPLIGLLGTLIGLVNTFVEISAVSGFATSTDLSRGVYQSLITSAGGLVISIPAYLFFSYLVAAKKTLMHDMERAGIEIVTIITQAKLDKEIIEFQASQQDISGEQN